jgi:hypothetical protein
VSFELWPLYLRRMRPRSPLDRKLGGGCLSPSGRGEENKISCYYWDSRPGLLAPWAVTLQSELLRPIFRVICSVPVAQL